MVDALRILTSTPAISLRSRANNLYLTAAPGTPLIANKTSAGTGEQFDIVTT
ncbi:hypothetical protein ABZ897_40745 [Nonomuraea sp. NPDC046802]|uniref:hypothetical protein n=1 Tax=Nonomuraea sp. NPDC046802 TaxID=3154919 RepID=UPI0033CE15BB